MKIEQLTPGQIVYDVHSHRMGNTTLRTLGVWRVRIIEVDIEKRTVVASWNGNPAQTYYGSKFSWVKEEPQLIRNSLGQRRRMTREEKKTAKEGATK